VPGGPADIDAALAAATPEAAVVLAEVRRLVREAVPDAQECIGYQMPAFRRRRIFFYFAAFKKHIGVYPPLRGDAALIAECAPYRNGKGNLAFPLGQPFPYDLVRRVAVALAEAYG